MPEALSKILQKVKNFWKELDKSQKIRFYIIGGIIAVALVAGLYLMTRTSYVPLFKGPVEASDMADVKAALSSGGINYKENAAGNNLEVSSGSRKKAEALLAQKGLPKNPDSIFADAYISKIGLSTTESDKNRFYVKEMQSEIAAKLKLMENIQDASVTLVIPDSSVLLLNDNQAKPTASVMIKPRGELTEANVNAVRMLVARSVEKLDKKDITIVDFDLNELTADVGDDSIAAATSRDKIRKERKKELEDDVRRQFIGQYTSFDGMAVVANPVLDFDTMEQQSKQYSNPSGTTDPSILTQDKSQIDIVNGTGTGGPPGVPSNPGTNTTNYQIGATGQDSTYKETHDKEEHLFNETDTQTSKATGEIKRDDSFLAINLKYGVKAKDVTQADIDSIKQLASAVTRIPVSNITVAKFQLIPPETVKVPITETIQQLFNTYGSLALLLILTLGLIIAVKPKKKKEEAPALEPAHAMAGGPRFIVPDSPNEIVPEIELEERSEVKKQIDKFVKQKPDAVAQLLRNWLADEWDM